MLSMYHHSNPVPHRSHKKSSNGCKACRTRKVKCDEKKPVCGKCALHYSNITGCDYEPSPRRTRTALSKTQPNKQLPRQIQQQAPQFNSQDSSPSSYQTLLTGRSTSLESDENGVLSVNKKSLQLSPSGASRCKCPCHNPEYSAMLLDSIFGICRICGNFPHSELRVDECNPIVSKEALLASQIDPFSILPTKSSPSVQSLIYHWVNTLALFPTKINSEYCTNQAWLTTAITNSALFNVTLYVCSLHKASLHSYRETPESLFYKGQTVNCLNECLKDKNRAFSDETIAAVLLLLFIVSITGNENEVDAHSRGLRQMISMRGGIHYFAIDGVFLHMLCTTNHLTAVLDESPSLHPPLKPVSRILSDSPSPSSSPSLPLHESKQQIHTSPLWKSFSLSLGFHHKVVEVFHKMGYLFSVCDAFTIKLLPFFRGHFEDIVKRIEDGEV